MKPIFFLFMASAIMITSSCNHYPARIAALQHALDSVSALSHCTLVHLRPGQLAPDSVIAHPTNYSICLTDSQVQRIAQHSQGHHYTSFVIADGPGNFQFMLTSQSDSIVRTCSYVAAPHADPNMPPGCCSPPNKCGLDSLYTAKGCL